MLFHLCSCKCQDDRRQQEFCLNRTMDKIFTKHKRWPYRSNIEIIISRKKIEILLQVESTEGSPFVCTLKTTVLFNILLQGTVIL